MYIPIFYPGFYFCPITDHQVPEVSVPNYSPSVHGTGQGPSPCSSNAVPSKLSTIPDKELNPEQLQDLDMGAMDIPKSPAASECLDQLLDALASSGTSSQPGSNSSHSCSDSKVLHEMQSLQQQLENIGHKLSLEDLGIVP